MSQTEPPPDQAAVAEEALHLLGERIGGDVEVLGLEAQQEVPYAAPDEERLEAALVQAVEHPQRVRGDVGA